MTVRPWLTAGGIAAAAFLAALPSPGSAQSLFAVGGLGVPVEPADARTRGLGGMGIGLPGAGLSLRDPAGAAGILIPTVQASLQMVNATGERNGVAVGLDANRFPHLGLAYPVGERGTAVFHYGSFLDQRWTVERVSDVDLAVGPVEVTDTFRSDGGVATVMVGGAYQLASWLSLGATGGLHTGSIRRTFTREFDAQDVGGVVDPYVTTAAWNVTGPVAVVGFRADPFSLLRVAGSVTWSGSLEAEPEEGEGDAVEQRSFSLPLELRAGISSSLTPSLSASAAVAWADWSDTGEDLSEGSAARTLSVGGGVEWTGSTFLGRTAPIRLGARREELPFRMDGVRPVETGYSLGSGLVLAQIEGIPLAGLDVTLERGTRSAGSTNEDFWRTTVTLRLSGS